MNAGNLAAADAVDKGDTADVAPLDIQCFPGGGICSGLADKIRQGHHLGLGQITKFVFLWFIGFKSGGKNNHAGFEDPAIVRSGGRGRQVSGKWHVGAGGVPIIGRGRRLLEGQFEIAHIALKTGHFGGGQNRDPWVLADGFGQRRDDVFRGFIRGHQSGQLGRPAAQIG